MYLRHTTRRKDGKTHVYWQLVRSVRRGRKVVQETVAHLGELDAQGRARAAALARQISGGAAECSQGRLFEPAEPNVAVAVKLDAVRLERSRSFGAVWLGWMLWQALKLDERCNALLPRGRASIVLPHWRGPISAATRLSRRLPRCLSFSAGRSIRRLSSVHFEHGMLNLHGCGPAGAGGHVVAKLTASAVQQKLARAGYGT